jgi:hypothetical protein
LRPAAAMPCDRSQSRDAAAAAIKRSQRSTHGATGIAREGVRIDGCRGPAIRHSSSVYTHVDTASSPRQLRQRRCRFGSEPARTGSPDHADYIFKAPGVSWMRQSAVPAARCSCRPPRASVGRCWCAVRVVCRTCRSLPGSSARSPGSSSPLPGPAGGCEVSTDNPSSDVREGRHQRGAAVKLRALVRSSPRGGLTRLTRKGHWDASAAVH